MAPNLYGLDRAGLEQQLAPLAVPRYRAAQLASWMYRRDATDPAQWSDVPAALRGDIASRFRVARPQVAARAISRDGSRKLVLDLPDGGQVEAVALPTEDRMTFCVSSQVGCAFGCAFCMTARLGFGRNLDAGEIVGQVAALAAETATPAGRYNVVYMGMGEPLHNLEAVLGSIRLLTSPDAFGLGPRRITVSTVGLPKGILRLAAEPRAPRLAISLVSADPEVRAALMPIARRVTLDELVAAVRAYGEGKRDLPTFEVVLLEGVNDDVRHAGQLAELAQRARAKVNLIEFNPTPELPFRPAPEERIEHFLRVLSRRGVVGTVRRSLGQDAYAACGQLAFLQQAP
ncbi:MAG: 23S rRNA (adenine(2503)-C(2))-methyltransferase RlmN [Acidobacteria bacterium]|nr:23S rRNA (adenine(2503)-C(2))-methyltransferase RlmN [Acidobacteriota bacterium]